MRSIPVLHDAEGVLVVDKPAGLETTGRTRDDPGGLEYHLARQVGRRVWPVHQLDRDTSGVLIFVRRKALVEPWQRRLRRSSKRYLAIARGRVRSQTVDAALAYDRANRRWIVRDGGKPARTELEALRATAAATLLEARPATGRTHQIRVHLASIGHPLLGEARHVQPACAAHPRHALHLRCVESSRLRFEAPVPGDLRALIERLGLT